MTTTVPGSHQGLASKLYHGETSFDFVGRRQRWFAISGLVILFGVISLGVRGLNFGIDFKGGTNWEVPAAKGVGLAQARSVVASTGVSNATVQTLKGVNGKTSFEVQAKVFDPATVANVKKAMAKLGEGDNPDNVVVNAVGPTWGHEITHKAEVALVAFFLAVGVFITVRFQAKMALSAIVAVIHDLLVTVGIYSIFGFDVTPNTVIAILTILGYSLYDTVVVFDKVDENTKGLAASGRMTYSDTVNVSMNQVLMRSINTSFVAILPILSVLVIGDAFLGASTLKEFGLALFVGLLTGAYSSIFIAAPILAVLKEREPRYATIRQRLEARGAAGAILTPRAAAQASAAGTGRQPKAAAATTAVLDPEDDDGFTAEDDSPSVIRPGAAGRGGRTSSGPARTAPARTASARNGPVRNGPVRPGGQRPAPKGRKKGGKHR